MARVVSIGGSRRGLRFGGDHALTVALLDFVFVPKANSIDDHRLGQDTGRRPAVNRAVERHSDRTEAASSASASKVWLWIYPSWRETSVGVGQYSKLLPR
jgi:hypothetical protein